MEEHGGGREEDVKPTVQPLQVQAADASATHAGGNEVMNLKNFIPMDWRYRVMGLVGPIEDQI